MWTMTANSSGTGTLKDSPWLYSLRLVPFSLGFCGWYFIIDNKRQLRNSLRSFKAVLSTPELLLLASVGWWVFDDNKQQRLNYMRSDGLILYTVRILLPVLWHWYCMSVGGWLRWYNLSFAIVLLIEFSPLAFCGWYQENDHNQWRRWFRKSTMAVHSMINLSLWASWGWYDMNGDQQRWCYTRLSLFLLISFRSPLTAC